MSDNKSKKELVIFNKVGELPSNTINYFKKINAKLVTQIDENEKIDVVLIEFHQGEFEILDDLFLATENKVAIISLSDVVNRGSFVTHNGKAILNPQWLDTKWGEEIWNLCFLGDDQSIHLDESYQNIVGEFKNFQLINLLAPRGLCRHSFFCSISKWIRYSWGEKLHLQCYLIH